MANHRSPNDATVYNPKFSTNLNNRFYTTKNRRAIEEARNRVMLAFRADLDQDRYSCVDNYRIALTLTPEEQDYYAQRDRGCCASMDVYMKDQETGLDFIVGCNYGH